MIPSFSFQDFQPDNPAPKNFFYFLDKCFTSDSKENSSYDIDEWGARYNREYNVFLL